MPETSLHSSRLQRIGPVLILVVVTILCLAPFAGKPFNIDDPLFIWVAQHIRSHPLDPYSFSVNWYGCQQPMYEIMRNPPLSCYYMALASTLVGWGEVGLHLAFLLPAIAAVLGTHSLAKRLCGRPLIAALAALLTPAFLVSSTTLMCDVTMLAFMVWSAATWVAGMEDNKRGSLILSSVLMSLCVLTKYNGVGIVLVLAAYAYMLRRGFRGWIWYMAMPAGVLLGYTLVSGCAYNSFGLEGTTASPSSIGAFADSTIVGLSFAGGCAASVLFFAPLLWRARGVATGLAMCVAVALLLTQVPKLSSFTLRGETGMHWAQILEFSLFLVGGLSIAAMALADVARRKEPGSLLLALWACGTFAFSSYLCWSGSGRYLLPMIPAVGILVARRLDDRKDDRLPTRSWKLAVALLLSAALAVSVTWADYTLAMASRSAARMLASRYSPDKRAVRFEGHWGFQYYIEHAGAVALDMHDPRVDLGDIVIIPRNASNRAFPPPDAYRVVDCVDVPVCGFFCTMDHHLGAGFYASTAGPLPFFIGSIPPERYIVCEVLRPWDGQQSR